MKLLFYKTRRTPVLDFINALDKNEQVTLLGCLKNIEDLGFFSPRVQFRHIKGKLWEIKIHVTQTNYRIFYVALHNDILVLLHAYKKQSQKAPHKEIMLAEKRLCEVFKNESDYLNSSY